MWILAALFFNKNKNRIIIVNLLLIIIFASIYYKLGTNENFYFINEPNQTELTLFNAFYFTLITHSTIGYSDIVPKGDLLRFITMIQSMSVLIFLLI